MTDNVDAWGRVVLDKDNLIEFLYKGLEESRDVFVQPSEAVDQYNHWCQVFDQPTMAFTPVSELDDSPEVFHEKRKSQWLMPESYQVLDIEAWLLGRCTDDRQRTRVRDEMVLFRENRMEDVLRLFLFITDTMKENNVLWGVGRGSSVASYCLFLIGIHRIDSLKYGLDIREFLRSE